MSDLNTVCGPIDSSKLGAVLMHEHIFTFHSDMFGDYSWSGADEFVSGAIDKLRQLKSLGFDSLVDLTVFGLGRDVQRVADIAAAASFNVIAATGIYTYCDLPLYFRANVMDNGPGFIEDLFVREIESGIGTTGIKAAIMKVATDKPGLTPDVELLLRATSRAHLRTGTPISTHSSPSNESGLIQQRIFKEEGVDLSRVVIGHSGDTTDIDYLERLIEGGSYLGMDRFGNLRNGTLEGRVTTVAELCGRGYADRMVLSHDANCGGDIRYEESLHTLRFGYITETVLPALRERGVSDKDIDAMLVGNPRKLFEG
jgi:phosphotriesterase-related protein